MSVSTPPSEQSKPFLEDEQLILRVVERGNMTKAYVQVKSNKGSAGVDRMGVEELQPYLHRTWESKKQQLIRGEYHPEAVLQVEIPKDGGGTRKLGIPTVFDRLIQQALYQTLSPHYEPGFSESSYGFRPGRSAHDAVRQSQKYMQEGYTWVVDIDLEKFFDEVNHDVLMGKLRRRIRDKSVLRLIRRYLEADVVAEGRKEKRRKGIPQGGPLSPLLANIMLDSLDKELERRGHRFCRYADDCNIYLRSEKAGQRVKESVKGYLEKHLRLKVNETKSAVDRPWRRKFLGYSFLPGKGCRIRVSPKAIEKFKGKIREIFRRGKGMNQQRLMQDHLNPLIRGWIGYFQLAEVKTFAEELDGWIRRHLRKNIWRQWKRPWTRFEGLKGRGIEEERARKSAFNGRGPWWNAGASHMNQAFPTLYFRVRCLVSMQEQLASLRRKTRHSKGTAGYGTVRPVV